MYYSLAILALLFGSVPSYATNEVDSTQWHSAAVEMTTLMQAVRTDQNLEVRQGASKELENLLKETLEREGSYAYDFSELEGVSILQPDDKAFKIFTWQLYVDKDHYKYHGFVQTQEGKVFPLTDGSDAMNTVEFMTMRHTDWYGALYYNLKAFQHEGETAYVLFGYDAYSFYNRRKVLDVLHFDDKGRPRFGKEVLQMKDGRGQVRKVKRFLMEYSSSVNVSLNYDEAQDLIIYDHLIYGSPIKGSGPSSVPDGSYCGLKLERSGMWTFVDKVHKDDPNNVLVNATSYEEALKDGHAQKKSKKQQKDIFGRQR